MPSRYMRLETHAYRARGDECAKEDAFTQLKNRNEMVVPGPQGNAGTDISKTADNDY